MRNRYIISYDIKDSKRLAKVFKIMRGFGDHLQYSVFKCDLSECEKILLIDKLNENIKLDEDKIMLVNMGITTGETAQNIEFIGVKTSFDVTIVKII